MLLIMGAANYDGCVALSSDDFHLLLKFCKEFFQRALLDFDIAVIRKLLFDLQISLYIVEWAYEWEKPP